MRSTKLIVESDVAIHRFRTGEREIFHIRNLLTVWVWDECPRSSAEYWAVVDYFSKSFIMEPNDDMNIIYWSSTPSKGMTETTIKSGQNQ